MAVLPSQAPPPRLMTSFSPGPAALSCAIAIAPAMPEALVAMFVVLVVMFAVLVVTSAVLSLPASLLLEDVEVRVPVTVKSPLIVSSPLSNSP